MFEVGVVALFTASHHLEGDFGPASEPHSHSYRVEVAIGGERLQPDGTLLDITVLQHALAEVIARVDGTNLNDLGEGHLVVANPTAEVIARFFFDAIASALRGSSMATLHVQLWESPQAYARYTGALA